MTSQCNRSVKLTIPHIRMATAGSKMCKIEAIQGAGGEATACFNHINYDADLRMWDFIGDDSRLAEMSARDPFGDTIHIFSVTINGAHKVIHDFK